MAMRRYLDALPTFVNLRTLVIGVLLLCVLGTLLAAAPLIAQNDPEQQPGEVDELREKILDRNARLLELQREIGQYREELQDVTAEKRTLQSTLRELELSSEKVATDIELTQNKIDSTDLQIRQLELEIKEQELLIMQNEDALARALQRLNELEGNTMIEQLLAHDNLADFWESLDELQQFQGGMRENLHQLQDLKENLETAQAQQEQTRMRLASLRGELSGERSALEATKEEKDALLEETANEEENYQTLIEQKEEERQRFLAELRQYESQLEFALNPATVPNVGDAVFAWPFSPDYMNTCSTFTGSLGNSYCITQYFGNTPFATSGAYNGNGHNGVDFRSPHGTRITAALAGTVVETGNTDATSGCYSYGKWVLVRHNNGLSTMYAHLSSVSVGAGQAVGTGEVLGFSGSSGYSTGPHLHFTVYATDGVRVSNLRELQTAAGRGVTGCSYARMPIAAHEAYMNPLDYLPYTQ